MKKINGRHRLAWAVACITGLMLLSACSSVPLTSASMPPDETAFVVPLVVIDIKQTLSTGSFGYRINLENVDTGEIRSFTIYVNTNDGYIYIKGFPEGKYLLKEYVPVGFTSDKPERMSVQKYLTVKKGVLTMLPAKIVITIVESPKDASSSNVYFNYYEFNEAYEKEMFRIINGEGPEISHVNIDPEPNLEWIPDWFTHWNVTASTSAPYFGVTDVNDYSFTINDDLGVSYTFSKASEAVLPLSFSASLKIPFYYNDDITTGIGADFKVIPGKTFYFLNIGVYFGYRLKPFLFLAEAAVSRAWLDIAIGKLGGSGAYFTGKYYDPATEFHATAVSYPTFTISLGAQWYLLDWMFLFLKYSFCYEFSFTNIEYQFGRMTIKPWPPLHIVTIPILNTITFGIGVGL